MTARDRAVMALTVLLDRFTPRSEWRHTDVSEIVDAIVEAAREPVSGLSREVADAMIEDYRHDGVDA